MALRELFFNNFWLKLFSLVMATLIWFAVAIQPDTRAPQESGTQIQVLTFKGHEITVMKAAADPRSFRVVPSHVDVTISGPIEVLQTLTDRSIQVFVNLTDAYDTEGLGKPVQVWVPPGLTLLKIEPDKVRLERVRSE